MFRDLCKKKVLLVDFYNFGLDQSSSGAGGRIGGPDQRRLVFSTASSLAMRVCEGVLSKGRASFLLEDGVKNWENFSQIEVG